MSGWQSCHLLYQDESLQQNLLVTMALEIVGVGRSFLAAGGRVPRLEFTLAHLLGMQRRAGPQVALALVQQMPDEDGQLAGCCHRHMLAAPAAHPQEERL
jgi:hypothetical protein